MAGGTKSQQSSQQTSAQQSASGSSTPWANPYALQGVQSVYDTYTANQPNLNTQVGKANALSDQLTKAAGKTSGVAGQASDYLSKVLGGGYLNSNPYLDAMIANTNRNVGDTVNSQFEQAGRYGSPGAYTGTLTRELANADNALQYNDYNTQMGRMDTAAQQAAAQQAASAGLAMGQQGQAAQLPYTGASTLAQALAALFSGGTSSGTSQGTSQGTSVTSPNYLQGIGSMLSGAAMFA